MICYEFLRAAFFAQQNAQAGDVLTLSPLHPEVKGQASITRWPATHPQAQAFRQFIRNGWSINSISVEVSRAGGEDTQPKRARKPRAATVDEDSSSVEYGSDLLYHLSSSPPTQHKSQAKAKQRCEERSEERICREEEELLVHFQKRAQLPPAVHRRFKKPSRQTKKTPQAKTNYRCQGSTLAPRRMKIGDENQSETEHFRCEASSSKGQSPAPSELRQSKTLRTTRHGHRIRKVRKDTVIENVIEGGRRRKSDLPHRSSFGERSSLESTLVSALRNLDTNKNR